MSTDEKKLVILYKKIKGKKKTIIYGFDLDKLIIENFINTLKKALGCGGFITKDESDIPIIEFMGDHREKIRNHIIEKKYFPNVRIDLKGA
jgi:translation initiation factor 1 (eIF-1/SUI1)